MENLTYRAATERDLPFIMETYNENIQALHGAFKSWEEWKRLLVHPQRKYYLVCGQEPVAWFRVDWEDDGFWLGMLQVKPDFHRRGIGIFVLSAVEDMAREAGFWKVGIHTTEDNTAAKALYAAAGYRVTEIGPCTTADGQDRVGYTFEKELGSGMEKT